MMMLVRIPLFFNPQNVLTGFHVDQPEHRKPSESLYSV